MKDMQQIPDTYYIFGSLFSIANRMDTLMERELKEFGITSKQWFLSMIIDNFFEGPPTIKEVAREMDSSHQNVKQVALKLQKKELLQLMKDKKDSRVTRLKMTEKSKEFWEKTEPKGNAFMKSMFKEVNSQDLKTTRDVITKIMMNLSEMGKNINEGVDEK